MNRKKILLVVDDSPTAILWHRLLLEDEGYIREFLASSGGY